MLNISSVDKTSPAAEAQKQQRPAQDPHKTVNDIAIKTIKNLACLVEECVESPTKHNHSVIFDSKEKIIEALESGKTGKESGLYLSLKKFSREGKDAYTLSLVQLNLIERIANRYLGKYLRFFSHENLRPDTDISYIQNVLNETRQKPADEAQKPCDEEFFDCEPWFPPVIETFSEKIKKENLDPEETVQIAQEKSLIEIACLNTKPWKETAREINATIKSLTGKSVLSEPSSPEERIRKSLLSMLDGDEELTETLCKLLPPKEFVEKYELFPSIEGNKLFVKILQKTPLEAKFGEKGVAFLIERTKTSPNVFPVVKTLIEKNIVDVKALAKSATFSMAKEVKFTIEPEEKMISFHPDSLKARADGWFLRKFLPTPGLTKLQWAPEQKMYFFETDNASVRGKLIRDVFQNYLEDFNWKMR